MSVYFIGNTNGSSYFILQWMIAFLLLFKPTMTMFLDGEFTRTYTHIYV